MGLCLGTGRLSSPRLQHNSVAEKTSEKPHTVNIPTTGKTQMEVHALLNTNESTWERNLKWKVDFLVSNSHWLPFKFFSQGLIHSLASFFFSAWLPALTKFAKDICFQDIHFFENKEGSGHKNYWGWMDGVWSYRKTLEMRSHPPGRVGRSCCAERADESWAWYF